MKVTARLARWSVLLAIVSISAAGCGGSSGTQFACTVGTGTSKTCFEISTNTTGNVSAAQMDCTNSGGVSSTTCSLDGADGACKMTTTSGSVSITETFWYYAGDAANEMQSCASGGGTWIAP